MWLGETYEDGILFDSAAKTNVLVGKFIHHGADGVTGIEPNVEVLRHLFRLVDDVANEAFDTIGGMHVASPKNGVNETIAQSLAVTRTIVVAPHGEAGEHRMVNRFLVVAVVRGSLLMTMHLDGKAIDVDRGVADTSVGIPCGGSAAKMSMRPVVEAFTKCFQVLFAVREPTDKSRLRRLTGHALIEYFFAGAVPRSEFDGGIMCEPIEIILPCISHGHGIDSFSQEFHRLITNQILPPRIDELIGK